VTKQIEADRVLTFLKSRYPEAHCELNFKNPYQLIVATILSAQCTDERVNKVTPRLFENFKNFQELSQADTKTLEDIVKSTGFFKNKAKSLLTMAQQVCKKHGGQLPTEMEDLIELAGVGRKTANVVLGNAFGIASGVVVDTHVKRLTQKWGWTRSNDAEKIEKILLDLIPKKDWIMFSHWVIWHGRRVCRARKPLCHECSLEKLCPKITIKV
jgi:endonuclease-3